MTAVIHVCTGCPGRDASSRLGPALADALEAAMAGDAKIVVRRYPCLGGCARGGRLSIAEAGRWSWLFAGLTPGLDLDALLTFIGRWRAAPAGFLTKEERPAALRGRIIGRVPPEP